MITLPTKYKIIALIGEAGSGKDTIMRQALAANNYAWHEIVSYTTRPPRETEVNGVNYLFVTPEKFTELMLNQELIECSEFNNWFYGTGYQSLRSDVTNVGVFNPAGIYALMEHPNIDLTVYYVRATPKNRLMRQLTREENPNVDEIIRRYKADKDDFCDLDFDYIELNNNTPDDLATSVKVVLGKTD